MARTLPSVPAEKEVGMTKLRFALAVSLGALGCGGVESVPQSGRLHVAIVDLATGGHTVTPYLRTGDGQELLLDLSALEVAGPERSAIEKLSALDELEAELTYDPARRTRAGWRSAPSASPRRRSSRRWR
jgi:hypothetical protein